MSDISRSQMSLLTVEALLICNVVDEKDAHSTSVVRGRDGSEPFLTYSDNPPRWPLACQALVPFSTYQQYPRSVT